jgi:glycosyltransferase involved in cell wall biosynthesis
MSAQPLVSIIIPTFNRANTVQRAINSALNQTYPNIELIIIDDGSTDNTVEILNSYVDSRIRIFSHPINKGVTAAKNSGLRQIKGDWFTILDSDDEVIPSALDLMLKIPESSDSTVTAVTCNCWDTTTNAFSGIGLTGNQYLDIKTLMTVCQGEFWGITKTSLLQQDSFNEQIAGFENILWYKINERANRYYIHAGLRIYHTEGDDRILKSSYDLKRNITLYSTLINEPIYLNQVKRFRNQEFQNICKNGLILLKSVDNNALAGRYYELITPSDRNMMIKLIHKFKWISTIFRNYSILKYRLKPYFSKFLKR